MRVRRLEARDSRAWKALFSAYIDFYQATIAEEVIDTTWRRLMAGGEGAPSPWSRSTKPTPRWVGAYPVSPLDLVGHMVLLSRGPVRRPRAARQRRRAGADRGGLPRGRFAQVHAHLLGDAGAQCHSARALRPAGDQVAVRAVPAVGRNVAKPVLRRSQLCAEARSSTRPRQLPEVGSAQSRYAQLPLRRRGHNTRQGLALTVQCLALAPPPHLISRSWALYQKL